MTEEDLRREAAALPYWQRHKVLILVAGVIVISLIMVSISLYLYNTTGVAQVDLTRPSYKLTTEQQVDVKDTTAAFAATGPLDAKTMEAFKKAYDQRAQKALPINYNPEALSDDSLQVFGLPSEPTTE